MFPKKPVIPLKNKARHTIEENGEQLTVKGKNYVIEFEKGKMINYTLNGKQVIKKAPLMNFWRPPTDNDQKDQRGLRQWRKDHLDSLTHDIYDYNYTQKNNMVQVFMKEVIRGPKDNIQFEALYEYSVLDDGTVILYTAFNPSDKINVLPKAGLQMQVNKDMHNVTWYGLGAHETYPDRKWSGIVDQYNMKVKDLFEPYIYPQENGNRSETRWVSLTDSEGAGLVIDGKDLFNFSAYHYDDDNITSANHLYELIEKDYITFNIDHKMAGLGTAACGPGVRDEFLLQAEEMDFVIRFSPVMDRNDADKALKYSIPVIDHSFVPKPVITTEKEIFNETMQVSITVDDPRAIIKYTLDGSVPDEDAITYDGPFDIDNSLVLNVMAIRGGQKSFLATERFSFVNAKSVEFEHKPSDRFRKIGEYDLVDGNKGNPGVLDKHWIPFVGDDMVATIELARITDIKSMTLRASGDWYWGYFAPEKVIFEISKDGKRFKKMDEQKHDTDEKLYYYEVVEFTGKIDADDVTHVRVVAENISDLPDWARDKNADPVMLIDELMINKKE